MGWSRQNVMVLLLGCCYMLGVSSAPMNTGFNLLVNPGFEKGSNQVSSNEGRIVGTVADTLYDNTDWAGDEVQLTYYLDNVQPRSGSRAQCVTVHRGFAQATQWIELPASKTYSLTLWVRVVTSSQVTVELGLRKMAADYDMYGSSQEVPVEPSAGWVKLRVPAAELPASDTAGGTLSVGFMFWVRAPGTVCFDDGSLYEVVDTPNDAYKLANPGFEDGSYDFSSAPADISGSMANGGWGDNTDWSPGASLRYYVSKDQAQSGSQSLAIQVLSGFAQFAQWRTLQVGAAYRLSIWARGVPAKKVTSASAVNDGTGPTPSSDNVSAAPAVAMNASSASITAVAAAAAAATTAGAAALGSVAAEATAEASAAAAATASAGMQVTLMLRLMGEPYTSFAAASMPVRNQWVQLTVPAAVIPWNAAGSEGQTLEVGFMVYVAGTGTVWLDSASLEPISDLPAITVPAIPKATITRNFLGMNINHIHEPGREYTWPAVDFRWFRTWDSGLVWPYIQRDGPNSWDWANMDKDIAQVTARQQKVLFTLGQTPTWASSEPNVPNTYGLGFGSVPSNVEDWKRFVRELLKRYGSTIGALEVWNEPNLQGPDGFFNGLPEQLATLALATQQVLQELGHKALLANPPMAQSADATAFLARYLAEANRLGVRHTAVAWHSYNMPPELDLLSMQTLRQVMAEQGLPASLPVFNSEAGILDGDFALYDNNHTFGAGYLARTYIINWAAGVRTLFWYAYDADTMEGLTMSSQEQPQPQQLNDAGRAYNNIVSWLMSARMTSVTRNQAGIWTAALIKGTSRSWIVWNGDQRVAFKQTPVPAGAKIRQDLITGATTSLGRRAQQITVGDVPVLLLA